jgi:uncharacterized protein
VVAIEWIFSFLALGAVVGFVAGLLGVGGGGIIVPVLSTIFIQQQVPLERVVHLALGTSMACIIVTSIASLHAHQKTGAIQWRVVRTMSLGIIIGTFSATFIAAMVNAFYLAIFFAGFMAFIAYKMLKRQSEVRKTYALTVGNLVSSAIGIGAVSALVSIGGGSLTVPFLLNRNIALKQAIATSAAIGLPISLAGTVGFLINGWQQPIALNYSLGFIYLPAFGLISITSFFTVRYGAKASHYLPVQVLKKLFAMLLVLLSVKMLWSVL